MIQDSANRRIHLFQKIPVRLVMLSVVITLIISFITDRASEMPYNTAPSEFINPALLTLPSKTNHVLDSHYAN